ncbi:MAG: chemotaxis-specific protein-glutamate methyltransferase CheB [Pseudomonadota bacterium]
MSIVKKNATRSVVIVDDARSWRRWLRAILEQDGRLNVVGEAGSAAEARDVIKATNPDVLTLDVEMPGMNGLRFLEHLMRLRPMPVVMFSGHTHQTSSESVRALSLGAVDCFHKTGDMSDRRVEEMRQRIYEAAQTAPQRQREPSYNVPYSPPLLDPSPPLMLVGASTGGVLALERTLTPMPAKTPPMVIVQHMPASFLNSFVARLDALLPHSVCLAEEGQPVARGHIALAPSDGRQTGVKWEKGAWRCTRLDVEPTDIFTPSVDRLFGSAVPWADRIVATVLTGIGTDGAIGAARLADKGAHILTQNEATCVVYGMPRAVRARVPDSNSVALSDMGRAMIDAVTPLEQAAAL